MNNEYNLSTMYVHPGFIRNPHCTLAQKEELIRSSVGVVPTVFINVNDVVRASSDAT